MSIYAKDGYESLEIFETEDGNLAISIEEYTIYLDQNEAEDLIRALSNWIKGV